MKISAFGEKFTSESGILQLMDDLGQAMAGGSDMIMMGGGNPGHIPEVQAIFRDQMQHILQDGRRFENLISNYDPPKGKGSFIDALARLLRNTYGWQIGPENIALTLGSQSSFFALFNLLAGDFSDGSKKKILFPLAPEYMGYAELGVTDDLFVARQPSIEHLDDQTFKYHVDFDALHVDDDISAICVSRPTNPTGNVLTDEEMTKLRAIAEERDIPLIIDNAYGLPFPSIIFTDASPIWTPNTILCMSLSKLGLPGTRTGIVIADEKIVQAIAGTTAIQNLSGSGFGAELCQQLVESGEIIRMSEELIKPYYQRKAEQAMAWLKADLKGYDTHLHKAEGALFLWLWCRGLPIHSQTLYERLKARGVLIVPGHHFFPGIDDAQWRHQQECIRITYSQDDEQVKKGLAIVAEEIKRAYDAA